MKAVYVASAGRNRVKVGVSARPQTRMGQLSAASGLPVKLAFERATDHPDMVERMAHWLLREKHRHGEWFKVTADEAQRAVEDAIVRVGDGEVAPNPGFGGQGRPTFIGENLNLLLPKGTKDRIKAALDPGEKSLAFIREAIDRELKRRERQSKRRDGEG